MTQYCLALILITFQLGWCESAHQWGYKNTATSAGPTKWAESYAACGGKKQSPILLDPATCKNSRNGPVKFGNYYEYMNNGHSLKINLDQERRLVMKGGPLKGEFRVEQFHFHWGGRNSVKSGKGSEHRITGFPSVMEMHVVTYNLKYPNFKTAVNKKDGLSVFGILFKEPDSDDDFHAVSSVGDLLVKSTLKKLIKPDTKTLAEVPVMDILLGLLQNSGVLDKYFAYAGSLTTPPCLETVQWIVSQRVLEVSGSTLKRLQKLKFVGGEPLIDNFRPLQALNGRTVFCN